MAALICLLQQLARYIICQRMHVENILYSPFFFFPENFSAFPLFEIQPIITLEGSVSYTFQREGINKVTVQVASGGAIMQDAKVITVKGEQRRRS